MSVHGGRHPWIPEDSGHDNLGEQLEAMVWYAVSAGIRRGAPLAAHIDRIIDIAVKCGLSKIEHDAHEQARLAVTDAIRPR